MSSQGSSTVSAVSGAVFGPMSSDPLYKDVSTTSASHTKSTPEVASRPSAREAEELAQEVVSTLGRQVDDEVKGSRLAMATLNP